MALSEADPVTVPGRPGERGILGAEEREGVLAAASALAGSSESPVAEAGGVRLGISRWEDVVRVLGEAGAEPGVECVLVDWAADASGETATFNLRTLDRRPGQMIIRREVRPDGATRFVVERAEFGRQPDRPAFVRRAERLRVAMRAGLERASRLPRLVPTTDGGPAIATPTRPLGWRGN